MKHFSWSLPLILAFVGCWGTLLDSPSDNPAKDSLSEIDADISNHISVRGGRIVEPDSILDSILDINDMDTSSVGWYFKYGNSRVIAIAIDSTKDRLIIPVIAGSVSWAWVSFSGRSILDTIIGLDYLNTAFRIDLYGLGLTSIPPELFGFSNPLAIALNRNRFDELPVDLIQKLNQQRNTLSSIHVNESGLIDLPQDWQELDPDIYFSASMNSICNLSEAELDTLRNRSDQFNVHNQFCNGDTVDILAR